MSADFMRAAVAEWRRALPALAARLVTLREPDARDLHALVELLTCPDASRFGVEEPVTQSGVRKLLDRLAPERSAGLSFTYAVTTGSGEAIVGLVQVRQLDPAFETAEFEFTLAPAVRGTGVFLESARLVGSFAFESVGVRRLEIRAPLLHGRANGALRKLGAVQEGVLRRSIRRHGEYFDQALWSVLRDDWGTFGPSTHARVH